MTKRWMYYGLFGSDPVRALPSVIAQARAVDPGYCWFYERLGGGVGLWLDSAAGAQRQAAERLREESARRNLELAIEFRDRQVSYPSRDGRDVRDELSAVSSDLAIKVLTGGFPERAHFDLAVQHMRGITGLVREADRLPFLFQCWYHWSASLTARVRVGCGVAARLRAGPVSPDTERVADAGMWRGYLRASSRIISAAPATSGAPRNYLLFDHAHRTHRRFGISPVTEALAVRLVRAECAAPGAVPLPDPA